MKDRRVLRGKWGTYQYDGAKHLVVDDGNFNDAWRVVKFVVAPSDVADSQAGGRDCVAVLATHPEAVIGDTSTIIGWNWEDRRQVAWSALSMFGSHSPDHTGFNLIDPQHIVVRDLYFALGAASATGVTEFVYFIELERVTLNDNQAVMAIIQEESQDVN